METITSQHISTQEAEHLFEKCGQIAMTVPDDSMEPFLKAGKDQVILVPVCDNTKKSRHTSLYRGDIILFRHHDECLLHRIYHIHGTLIITRGDNIYGKCEKITTADVIARVKDGTCHGGKSRFHSRGILWCTAAWFWRHTYKTRKYFRHLKKAF